MAREAVTLLGIHDETLLQWRQGLSHGGPNSRDDLILRRLTRGRRRMAYCDGQENQHPTRKTVTAEASFPGI